MRFLRQTSFSAAHLTLLIALDLPSAAIFFRPATPFFSPGRRLCKDATICFSTLAAFEKERTEDSSVQRRTAKNKAESEIVLTSKKKEDKPKNSRVREVEFISPLLRYGYRRAVEDFEMGKVAEKPILLYLPGFDGTFLSPFLQFPELSTVFDVRCMTVSTNDRSTYAELKKGVLAFLRELTANPDTSALFMNGMDDKKGEEPNGSGKKGGLFQRFFSNNRGKKRPRPIYLAGESFGGILAMDVALTILEEAQKGSDKTNPFELDLQGLCVINAATCFDRSRLAAEAPPVSKYPPVFYTIGLLKLLPLFMDEYSFDQLLLILSARALPSVIDNEMREAYLGRVALSLPFVIPFMNQGLLQWRLKEWLTYGSDLMLTRLSDFSRFPFFRTLIVAGEKDATLPSIDEAERLASLLPPPSTLHVVEGAGHASTCGARVDLTALFCQAFPELRKQRGSKQKRRTSMKEVAAAGQGAYFGMEPRYDNATIGLSPLKYWDKEYFKRYIPVTRRPVSIDSHGQT